MNLRTKGPLLLVIAASAISGGTGYASYRRQDDAIRASKEARLKEVAEQLRSAFEQVNRDAKANAELFASLPLVHRALKADDRDALVQELEHTYKLMNSRYSAEAASFSTELPAHKDPETKAAQPAGLYSILRLTNTKVRQEFDQSKRDMVVRADHSHETQAGVELMATSCTVRAVASVDSGSEHLGCFEWGVGFARTLQTIKDRTHADVAVFVDEKQIPQAITDRGRQMAADWAKAAEADRVAQGYRTLEGATNTELMRQLVTADFLGSVQQTVTRELPTVAPSETPAATPAAAPVGSGVAAVGSGAAPARTPSAKPVVHEAVAADVLYGVVAVPLFDFTGRRVGVLVGVRSLDEERHLAKNTLTMFVGATLVGIILLAGIFQLVLNGLLVRPTIELAENAKTIAGGDLQAKLDAAARSDELGALAKQVEKLRDLLREAREAAEKARAQAASETGPGEAKP